MAIEKSLYQTPEGIGVEEESTMEIGIVNPEMVTLDDGSVEITLVPEEGLEETMGAPFDANLAEYLEDSDLIGISSELIGHVEGDTSSRKEWADTFVKGLDGPLEPNIALLDPPPNALPKSEPFPCCKRTNRINDTEITI